MHKNSEKLEIVSTDKQKSIDPVLNLDYTEISSSTVEVLLQARKTLKYSYVYAYHLDRSGRRAELDLFECHQQDLENHTERLSQLATDTCDRVVKEYHIGGAAHYHHESSSGRESPSAGAARAGAAIEEAKVPFRELLSNLRDQSTATAKVREKH